MSEEGHNFSPASYRQRRYRRSPEVSGYVFETRIGESDLWVNVSAPGLEEKAYESLLRCRSQLENFVAGNPEWSQSLVPVPASDYPLAPVPAKRMMTAAEVAGVGPMAAVAGAVAEAVGLRLLQDATTVVIENGGDIFLAGASQYRLAIFAGNSPLSGRVGIQLEAGEPFSCGVCTSSGRVGHSLSFGRADAVTIVADDAPLADAVATAMANRVRGREDLAGVIERALRIPGVNGAVAIYEDGLAAGGELELIGLPEATEGF
ncbi:MAG: UPF0280 family protein [Deltaproteobacteria bacterium]|nr:UPF0280 family protein [Deltaproteobacteria bacterium]